MDRRRSARRSSRAIVRRDAVVGDRRPLFDARAHRAVAAAHAEQGRRRCRVAGADGWAICPARPRGAFMAGRVLPMGCGPKRSESASGKRRNRRTTPGTSFGFGAHGGTARSPRAPTCHTGLIGRAHRDPKRVQRKPSTVFSWSRSLRSALCRLSRGISGRGPRARVKPSTRLDTRPTNI